MIYMLWSLRYGRIAGPNPWGAVGLEWQTSSPPPTENFLRTPVVTEETYHYSERGENHCLAQRLSLINSTTSNSSACLNSRHVGIPSDGNHVLRWDVRGVYSLSLDVPPRLRPRKPIHGRDARNAEHDRTDHQQLDHGSGSFFGTSQSARATKMLLLATIGLGLVFLWSR